MQIEVCSPLKAAIESIDRRMFFPVEFREQTAEQLEGTPVPFGDGQTIPTKAVTELMLELLEIKPTDVVMEIGTGSGYQTAILSGLCAEVHSLEIKAIDPELRRTLPENVHLYNRNGIYGVPDKVFDAVFVSCGVMAPFAIWFNQLKEGGRIVAPVGDAFGQAIRKYVKRNGYLRDMGDFAYARFVPLEF